MQPACSTGNNNATLIARLKSSFVASLSARTGWIKPGRKRITRILFSTLSLFPISAQAGTPVWTLTPLTATTISVPTNSSANVQYRVSNQSKLTHTLKMNPIQGITQLTSGAGLCNSTFALQGQSSCVLSLEINGSQIPQSISGGPVVCQQGNPIQCYQPSSADVLKITQTNPPSTATLSVSMAELALSVDCPTAGGSCVYSNAALTGRPRTVTITNISSSTATNVAVSASSLPAGTSVTPTSCGSIDAGQTCVLTITPGQIASSSPATLSVAGDNTNTVTSTVNVLTYGSVYQSGYVFAMDDSTAASTSVSGKVAALNDQSSSIPWDPGCPGSCTAPIATDSFHGLTNTSNIANALSLTHAANTYAAGLCYNVLIDGYSDWYLPAICEMGFDSGSSDPCGDSANPAMQNMQSNLVNPGIVPLNSNFWSSTQTPTLEVTYANYNDFGNPGTQPGDFKEVSYAVRCARIITP